MSPEREMFAPARKPGHLNMSRPHLTITKRMALIHGKMRPLIEVKATVSPDAMKMLIETFPNETLFKRTAYTTGFGGAGLQPSPALERMLNNFVKNDACPEVTVKTLIQGQKFEGTGVWDIQCFDFVAKRSFDALLELVEGVAGFGTTATYQGANATADLADFNLDTISEMATAPATIPEGGIERMADAA
jgi:hypothetical protein